MSESKEENSEPAPNNEENSAKESSPAPENNSTKDEKPAENSDEKPEHTLQELFTMFSKFGDIKSDGKSIGLSQIDKWLKQSKVIDGKKISTTDTGICFNKLKNKKISFGDFKKFLDELAKYKKVPLEDINTKLLNGGPPGTSKTTAPSKVGIVDRLTDTSRYTGCHKERFDQTGKGRGLEGRTDKPGGVELVKIHLSAYIYGKKSQGLCPILPRWDNTETTFSTLNSVLQGSKKLSSGRSMLRRTLKQISILVISIIVLKVSVISSQSTSQPPAPVPQDYMINGCADVGSPCFGLYSCCDTTAVCVNPYGGGEGGGSSGSSSSTTESSPNYLEEGYSCQFDNNPIYGPGY